MLLAMAIDRSTCFLLSNVVITQGTASADENHFMSAFYNGTGHVLSQT